MTEDIKNIISKNKEVFIATLNKFLDTYYTSNGEDTTDENAVLYEGLRKKVIKEEELSDLDISLLLILVSYQINKFKGLEMQYKLAHEELGIIQEELQQKFNDRNLDKESKI